MPLRLLVIIEFSVLPPALSELLHTDLFSVSFECAVITPPNTRAEYCDQFLCLCLSVREHIPGTAGPIFMKFCVQIPCGRGSVLWRRCDTLCTSGFMDDITFGRSGPYGDAWKVEPLTYYH